MQEDNERNAGGGCFTKLMLRRAAGIHESLGHHAQTGVHYIGLTKVENKVGVLDQVHPEPVQRDK